jgi:mannose-6-phosphate isomerase-like protein (cupin superfamily)
MPLSGLDVRLIGEAPDAIAPDGSEVWILCGVAGGGTALFRLRAGAVSRAVTHGTVEEIWYVVAGEGRIWRRLGGGETIDGLAPGVSLTIPLGTRFQFRNDGLGPLDILGVTMPPWPGSEEARPVAGKWIATL